MNKKASYYQVINGQRYDRALLEKAKQLTQGQGDGRISVNDMEVLFNLAQDGGRITSIEAVTLSFITQRFNASQAAIDWLSEQGFEEKTLDALIERIVRKRLGLSGLQWVIPEEEVARQVELDNQQTFEEALFDAIEAFLNERESSTSLADIVSLETGIDLSERAEIDKMVRAFVNTGTLFLVPLDFLQQQEAGTFTFKTPIDPFPIQEFWLFGLEIPDKTQFNFIALVRRQGFQQAFSFGYIPQAQSSQQTITDIIEKEFQLPGLQWQMATEEIKLQQKLPGTVSFSTALRNALHNFINYSKNDDTIWVFIDSVHGEEADPSVFEFEFAYKEWVTGKIRNYMDSGFLYLVPQGIRELDDFEEVYPAEQGELVSENWIFMLYLPGLSDHMFWAIVDRAGEKETYHYGFG